MQLLAKLQQKDLLQGNTMNLTNWVIIIVRFAEIIFSVQILNSHPPADGRVFLKPIKMELLTTEILPTEWKELKWSANAAIPILVTFSMMDRLQPECVIA